MTSQSVNQFSSADYVAMSRALQLAKRGLYTTSPNPRVGAVVVKNGKIIGEGWHRFCGGEHAEVIALRQAGAEAKGASCFITLEPCSHYGKTPPCSEALVKAGITRVVAAIEDPNPKISGSGIQYLKDSGVVVELGLMQAEATALNPGFILRMKQQRPWIVSKLAMSTDGRTALANGESQWISCEQSREDVQRLRAQVCAIITGSGTVLADNPRMNVRLDYQPSLEDGSAVAERQPLKVVIDGSQQLNPDYTFFKTPALIVVAEDATNMQPFIDAGVAVMKVPRLVTTGKLDLHQVVRKLATEYEVNELMVEAGAELNGAFLESGLIDQMQIYMAPKLLGNSAKGLFHLPKITTMKENIQLQYLDIKKVGVDVKITCSVVTQ
jgi:diaminohydroxyphosphoribosylaminopyrimidine deaminase/5-amino-6-(5-phosphoribosylamino)uracil reductase